MDEDRDDAAAGGREPLDVQLHRKLSEIPGPLPLEEAAAMLVADLETSRDAFTRHDQMGCAAAMMAAVRMCHALGRPELGRPFATVAAGLRDLRQGRAPTLFRKAREPEGNAKTSVEWNLSVTVSVYLEVLSKELGMKMDDAAKEVARILDKRKVPFGRSRSVTWRSVKGVREEIRRRPRGDEIRNQYFRELTSLRKLLAPLPPDEREAAVLGALDLTVRAEGRIPGLPPSNP